MERESFVGLLFLALAGRRPDENERGLLEDIAVAMTVAYPRIWPLKLGRLASSYGGCLAAVAAITVCLEGAYIGHWTSLKAAQLLIDAGHALGPLTRTRRAWGLDAMTPRRRPSSLWLRRPIPAHR